MTWSDLGPEILSGKYLAFKHKFGIFVPLSEPAVVRLMLIRNNNLHSLLFKERSITVTTKLKIKLHSSIKTINTFGGGISITSFKFLFTL